jgi:hypothetical protein
MTNRVQQILNSFKGERLIQINDTASFAESNGRTELIPNIGAFLNVDSQHTLATIRWMIQKSKLNQDMYLIGDPGPYRRHLALLFCQLLGREVEYIRLSKDITDSDLKQRKEIINKSVIYIDQPCVRAALKGRVLILDGIEVISFSLESRA